jgi:hypothetical protein
MRSEILDLQVIEGGFFNGQARIRFDLDIGGRSVWEATLEGKSKRWGRSNSPENYNEALSNAFNEVVRQLVQDESFGKALSGASEGRTL